MAGSLGVSALICLLNNGDNGQSETLASMLGPFWREDQPLSVSGATLVRSTTPGPGLVVDVRVEDGRGQPVEGAEVDVWHSSPEGLYENQDPTQAEMNLRGRFMHRLGRPVSLQERQTGGLSNPNRRTGWRAGQSHGAPQLPPGASALHDLQARLQDPDFADLRA